MNKNSWRYWLVLTLLGFIIVVSLIYILKHILNQNYQGIASRNSNVDAGNAKGSQLLDIPDTFDKNFYTPVIPVKFKAQFYKEIKLPDGDGLNPVVSPDGSQVVLIQKKGTVNLITIIQLSSSKIDVLELGLDNYFDPSWNAEATKIVFAGSKGTSTEIYTYDLKNKKLNKLTDSPLRKKYWPRFSPYQFDTQYRIAYVSEDKGRKDIWWVKESGKDDQPITLPPNAIEEHKKIPWNCGVPDFVTQGGDSPEWSPSGNVIIYRTNNNRYTSLNYDHNTWWQEGALSVPAVKGILLWAPNQSSFLEYDYTNKKTYIMPIETLRRKEVLQGKIITSSPSYFPDGKGFAYVSERDGKSMLIIEPYNDPFGDIVNLWMYPYNKRQKDKLIKNNLLFLDAKYGQIYNLYDTEFYNGGAQHARPYFVTSDAVLETFYAAFSALLGYAEKVEFVDALQEFSAKGLEVAKEKKLSKEVENLFLVGISLIKPGKEDNLPVEVRNELRKIRGASTSDKSFFNQEIEYSDFFIRGKYEKDKDLQNYFRALKWFQVFKFDLEKEPDKKYVSEILSIVGSPKVSPSLERIIMLLQDVIGESRYYTPLTLKSLPKDGGLPEIKTGLTWIKTEKYFKIFPSIYTLDAFIFDELITHLDRPDTVGTDANPRLLPVGMDVMAALGSTEAKKILLEELKEGRFKNYEKRLNKVTDNIQQLSSNSWEKNIYQNWLDTFNALIKEPANSPEFTKSEAWKRKQLNTALGSWVNLRYETVAYVEQVGAEGGECGYERLNIGMPRGYVEPNPLLFQKLNYGFGRISGKFKQIIKNPELRDAVIERIDKYRKHLKTMETISRKELDNVMLTDEEYAEILYIGRTIEHFILIMGSIGPREELQGLSIAQDSDSLRKVVDVQKVPPRFGSTRLYEALGYAHEINVVVPYYGRRLIVRGPVYSYYEFRSPEQWDSAKWKKSEPYKLPQWIDSYYEGKSLERKFNIEMFRLRKK